MNRRPTLADVARRSGVSGAAVSYVLNNRSDKTISETTRAQVLQAAAELRYVPNAAATALVRGRSNVVMVVVDATFTGAVSARTVETVTADISALGYAVIVHTMVDVHRLCDVVGAVQPYGVLVLNIVAPGTRAQLMAAGAQHVLGYEPPDGADGAQRFWEVDIGRAQLRHLAERGHRRIAYLLPTASPRLLVARCRLAGVASECGERGLVGPLEVSSPLDRGEVAIRVTEMRRAGVTALCTDGDRMGLAVLAALADLGLSAPDDLAVIGADNDPESALSTPTLTTAWLPDADYGVRAATWFRAVAHGEDVDTGPVMDARVPDVEIIQRNST